MPCRLCRTAVETGPDPQGYITPLMSVAIPHFNHKTDFLCANCFDVYYEVIEEKYNDKILKYLHFTQIDASPPPPPPPLGKFVINPLPIERTAFSSRIVPNLVKQSRAEARKCAWKFDFLSPPLAGVTPSAWSYWRVYKKKGDDGRPDTPEPPNPLPPIEAHCSITVDFPTKEKSEACSTRSKRSPTKKFGAPQK